MKFKNILLGLGSAICLLLVSCNQQHERWADDSKEKAAPLSVSTQDDPQANSDAYKQTATTQPDQQYPSPYKMARQALIRKGYKVSSQPNEVDGTTAALRKFQADHDIPSTGTLDDATLKALGIHDDRQPTSVDEVEDRREP